MAEIRNPKIPFLPGTVFADPKKQDFKKSHTFGFKNGLAIVNLDAPGIGGEALPEPTELPPVDSKWEFPAAAAPDSPSYEPDFVKFDRVVLRFFAYFKETVQESAEENFRVRKCYIDYYVVDGSIMVLEPKIENSGLPQGQLLRRHRIPKSGRLPASSVDAKKGEFFELEDLKIGAEVTFYGKTMRIYDCNESTRAHLLKKGIEVPEAEPVPVDPYLVRRTAKTAGASVHKTLSTEDALKKFLENDRKVLRFYCLWDDKTMYGERRKLVLHYFLADDTVEVLETREPNCGRDPFPAFMKRGRLPKKFTKLLDIADAEAVTDKDLVIGSTLDVYNREVLLYDADEFTKEYYRLKYGITEFPSVEIEEEVTEEVERVVPPYTGFGSEEDSLATCTGFKSKGGQRDFSRLAALDGVVLRFLAKFHAPSPQFEDRRLVINFYPGDDTIGIFEPPARNSGIVGGKFLERMKVKKPDGSVFTVEDLEVGKVVSILGNEFEIVDADKFALKWIAENEQWLRR